MCRVTPITLIVLGLMMMIHVKVFSREASDLPLLIDLAQLELKVTDTGVVDHISTIGYPRTTLSAKKGYKLVVVRLEGEAEKPCCLTLDITEFTAVYEKETTDYEGKKKHEVLVRKSSAIMDPIIRTLC